MGSSQSMIQVAHSQVQEYMQISESYRYAETSYCPMPAFMTQVRVEFDIGYAPHKSLTHFSARNVP